MQYAINIRKLSFKYNGKEDYALKDINLNISQGEFVLICGHTGCGKSTLLSCINGLIPYESGGQFIGRVYVLGKEVRCNPAGLFPCVATVFQNPNTQIISGRVCDELAFGLENLNIPPDEMDKRIDEALRFVGLSNKKFDETQNLSGGQKQRLAIACALCARPKILLLDEPVSQLDPKGTKEILEVIKQLSTQHEITVLLVEHRIEQILPWANRVIKLKNGKIVFNDSPDKFKVYEEVQSSNTKHPSSINLGFLKRHNQSKFYKKPMIILKNLYFSYPTQRNFVLKDINLNLKLGERIAIIGENGSGKSTLLKVIAGILKPTKGSIEINLKSSSKRLPITLLLQDPDLMLFKFSVFEELAFSLENLGAKKEEINFIVKSTIEGLGLTGLENEPPFSLSAGQRLRVALGSLLTGMPQVLLLDEPTTGQDRRNLNFIISALSDSAELLVMSTHDHELAQNFATRIIEIAHGEIINLSN